MTEQKMTRTAIKTLGLAIDKILARKTLTNCIKFHYALVRNLKMITPKINSYDKVTSDKLESYRKEGKEAVSKFALLDDKGNKVKANGMDKVDPDKLPEFEKFISTIEEKHKESLKEANDFMDEEESIKLYSLVLSTLPTAITGDEIFNIDVLIEDNTKLAK